MSSPKLLRHAELPSTQDAAKDLAAKGAEHFTVVTAARQTAGRGQFDRKWESPAGNLYFSVILRPSYGVDYLPYVSLDAANAVASAVYKLTQECCAIKPPNDVYARGKKLAGVLTESSTTGGKVDWVVVGVGLNVDAAPDFAIGLKELKAGAGVEEALEACLEFLRKL